MTRNEILEIVKQFYENNVTEREVAFARFVMAIEREACAKVCENYTDNHGGKYDDLEGHGYECAEAIRARGEK